MTLYEHITNEYGSIMAYCRKFDPKNPHRLKRTLYNWQRNPDLITIGNAKELSRRLNVPVCEFVKLKKHKDDE